LEEEKINYEYVDKSCLMCMRHIDIKTCKFSKRSRSFS